MEFPNLSEAFESLPSTDEVIASLKEKSADVSEYLSTKTDELSKMTLGEIHQAAVDKTSQGIENAASKLDSAVQWVKDFWNNVAEWVNMWIDATKTAYNSAKDTAVSWYKSAVSSTLEFIEDSANTLASARDAVKQAGSDAYDVAAWTLESVPDVTLWDMWNTIKEWATYVADAWVSAYDVAAWTLESVQNVTLADVWNTIKDWFDAVAWMGIENAVADTWSQEEAKQKVDWPTDKLAIATNLLKDISVKDGYSVNVDKNTVVISNKFWSKVRYFTPANEENSSLLSKDTLQTWVNNSISNYEKTKK